MARLVISGVKKASYERTITGMADLNDREKEFVLVFCKKHDIADPESLFNEEDFSELIDWNLFLRDEHIVETDTLHLEVKEG